MTAHPILRQASGRQTKALLAAEAKRRRSGDWGPWERLTFPPGSVGATGWLPSITMAMRNRVFSVLFRDAGDGVLHLAITSLPQRRPTFHEMQRIKDELTAPSATAVEVYPPRDELIDEADMYHLWVLPGRLPFTLAVRS